MTAIAVNTAIDSQAHSSAIIAIQTQIAGLDVPLTATATQLNLLGPLATTLAAVGSNAARYVAGGATRALTSANDKQTIKMDTAGGTVVTLPAATGSGVKFKFLVTVLATSASHKVQVANAADFMIGVVQGVSDDPATMKGWIAANSGTVATNSDTITLNRTTTGSVSLGEYVDVEDVAANTWAVSGVITQTGTEATPFSAAV